MANQYLSIAELKRYFPSMFRHALADNNDDGIGDDSILQQYIDNALPYLLSRNPALADLDPDVIKAHCVDYVIMQLYDRMGVTEKALYYRQKITEGLKVTTGKASKSEDDSVDLREIPSKVFTDDEFEKW
jgi:hypothetical protein